MILWDWIQTIAMNSEDDAGASIVEYALLVAFIAIVSIAVLTVVGGETSSIFDSAGKGFP